MKKTIYKYMSVAAVLLSAASCTMGFDPLPSPNGDGDKVTVNFTVGLDGMIVSRGIIGDDDYNYAETNPEFSDGTRATFLIYALFDEEGNNVAIPDPKGSGALVYEVCDEVTFPLTISLDLFKDQKYKLGLWAQQGDRETNRYYDSSNLKAIRVYYNRDDDDMGDNLNNDEKRDAFCATVDIDPMNTPEELSVTLRRPFAQVNIGVSEKAWKALQMSNVHIKASDIVINHVAWNYNLFEGVIVDDVNEVEGNTQSYKTASYMKNTIPYFTKISDTDETENHPLRITIDNEEKVYYWLSMSYVLVGGNQQSSVVDISDINFYYNNTEDGTADDAVSVLKPSNPVMNNVPVRRNYRTNILFDDDLTGTAKIVLDLNSKYEDDIYSSDWGESWEGRIARGVTAKSYRGVDNSLMPADKQNQWGFWIDFNVSSAEGLKWLMRRSNGVDFTMEDIPTWQVVNKEGQLVTTTYKEFQDANGNPNLQKYMDKVYEMVYKHGLVANYVNVVKDINKPWSFDDAAIIMSNDIDFNGEVITEPFSTIHAGREVPSGIAALSPILYDSFRGTFDGNGYTIMNVTFDCQQQGKGPGSVMHEGAGLFGVASERATIKNLRMFNTKVIGDWNIGAIVGFYGTVSDKDALSFLTIDNVTIENCNLNSIASTMNPNGDGNLGGFVGSLQGTRKHTISNSKILNTPLNSQYVVGALIGVLGNPSAYITNCVLMDVPMVLSDYNAIGNGKDFNLNLRNSNKNDALLFGNNIEGSQAKNNLTMSGVTLTNVGLGIFAADNKQNTTGLDGIGTVIDLPLENFPVLEARYGRGLTMLSHITGKPSYTRNNMDFGMYVDMTQKLVPSYRGENDDMRFLISGEWNNPTDLLYTLNVKPGANDTYGIGFVGKADYKPVAVVKDMIINGVPTVSGGIYFDNISDITLDNIAIYNVPQTLVFDNVPSGAKLTVERSDLRGDVIYGSEFGSVSFTNTAFYVGTGTTTGNFKCKPGTRTSFKDCHFREGFKFELPEGFAGTLTFENCFYGRANEEQNITAANIKDFLGIEADNAKVVVK